MILTKQLENLLLDFNFGLAVGDEKFKITVFTILSVWDFRSKLIVSPLLDYNYVMKIVNLFSSQQSNPLSSVSNQSQSCLV